MQEALTLPGHLLVDTDLTKRHTNRDYSDWLMERLATYTLQAQSRRRNTLAPERESYIDTAIGFLRQLNLSGVLDWSNAALESLDKVYAETQDKDWDGYGAEPVSHKAFIEAQKLLRMIPPSFPMPEVLVEPDGEIGFEWYRDKDHVFVISLGGENTITYAGLFGRNNKTHGTESFTDKLPQSVLENIRRVFPVSHVQHHRRTKEHLADSVRNPRVES